MKKKSLLLGLMLMTAGLTSAQGDIGRTDVGVFPKANPGLTAQKAPNKAPQRVVNDDKLNGKTMYATTLVDYY